MLRSSEAFILVPLFPKERWIFRISNIYVLFSQTLILILLDVVFIFYIDGKASISQNKTVIE